MPSLSAAEPASWCCWVVQPTRRAAAREARREVLVDAMNRRPPFDGTEPALDADGRGTTEIVAESNPRARWAKSFSNLGYHDLEDDPRTSGAADRRAIVVIGDGSQAAAVVCRPHRPTRSTPSPTGR
jgi:predicted dinucleotide-binding enzyme